MASILAVGTFFAAPPSNLELLLPVMLGLLVVAAVVAAWSFWRWKKSSDVHLESQTDFHAADHKSDDRPSSVLPLRAGSLSLGASLAAPQSASKLAPVEKPAAHADVPAAPAHSHAPEPARELAGENERKAVVMPRSVVPLSGPKPSVNDFGTLRTRVAPSAQASALPRVAKTPAAPVPDDAATYAPSVPQLHDQMTQANRVAPVEPHEDIWPQPRGLVTRAQEAPGSPSAEHLAPSSPAVSNSEPAQQPLPAEIPTAASAQPLVSDSALPASAPSAMHHPEAQPFASQPSLFASEPEAARPSALPLNAAGGEVDLAALLFEDLDLPADWEIKAEEASSVSEPEPEPALPVASVHEEAAPPAQSSPLALEDIYHIVARPSAESSFAEPAPSGVCAESETAADALPSTQPEPAPESEPASEPALMHTQHEVPDAPLEAASSAGFAEPAAAAPPWPEPPGLPAPVFVAPPSPSASFVPPAPPAPRVVRAGYVALGARYPQCHRLSLGIPITIRGLVWRDETLTEDTWTLTVLPNGAIINLASVVAPDEELILVNNKTGEQIGCRVVAMTNAEASRKHVEIEFKQPAPRFWRITFPPADWSPSQRKRSGSGSSPNRDDVPEIIRS